MFNREEKFGFNIWSFGEFAVEVRMNIESNFETSQEVHKRGEIQIKSIIYIYSTMLIQYPLLLLYIDELSSRFYY
jgi:hypothetical protein